MRAIILCAGMGKRITEHIGDKPKCLLEVGERTIIERQLNILSKVTDEPPILVVGYEKEMIMEKLKGMPVEFVENAEYATTNILTSLWCALRDNDMADSIICLPGDLVFAEEIMGDLIGSGSKITIAVQKRQCDEEAVKVSVSGKSVQAIGKKIQYDDSSMEFLGIFKVDKSLVALYKKEVGGMISSGQVNGYMFSSIQSMIEKGTGVGYVDVGERDWEEIDFIEDLTKAKERFGS